MAKNRKIEMTEEEINRCKILRMVNEKQITQKKGAREIHVTERHFTSLLQRYRAQGPECIVCPGHRTL